MMVFGHRLRRQDLPHLPGLLPRRRQGVGEAPAGAQGADDSEASERMRGTVSFPFKPGEHGRIAVEVIDFRGNEVVRVVNLP